jgi:signal transduction histidine kinase
MESPIVHDRRRRSAPTEFAALRFVAGMRALLAVLGGVGLLTHPASRGPLVLFVLPPYLIWTAALLWKTLGGWPLAASRLWPWLDAAVLLVAGQLMVQQAPSLGVIMVLPVVAMALLAGVVHAAALALACASTLLLLAGWQQALDALPALPLGVPIVLLAVGPAVALLTRPSRELLQRQQLLGTFNARSDPRQGLRHHVDVLLELLAIQFKPSVATLSLHGPEPRIFQWRRDSRAQVLDEPQQQVWREHLAALPRDMGCVFTSEGTRGTRLVALSAHPGARGPISDSLGQALQALGGQTLTLPLVSYGQASGQLCLCRADPPFTAGDVHWLHEVMRETLPLLERSDLLEQLQRETAAHERERIGRDLHDSAVQPYLGLKYGLEALARKAGPDNPVRPDIDQLLMLTTEELQTLRDVVSGLRNGQDPASRCASLVALQRQVDRFQALYGLKVHVFAPQAPRLRGAAAKAVLHMVNEALTNVRRHTSATAVTVLLDMRQTDLVMRLRNDLGSGEAPASFVPRSLTERANELGGSVAVTREPDFTEIAITLPLIGAIG